MMRRLARASGILLLLIAFASCGSTAAGLRSVGLRVILPFGELPALIGLDVSTGLSFGLASATLFLSRGGRTLVTASVDIALVDQGETFVRLTTGFYYFERNRLLPSLLIGGGLSYKESSLHPLDIGIAGEFLYPISFPFPMFSLTGGWMLP